MTETAEFNQHSDTTDQSPSCADPAHTAGEEQQYNWDQLWQQHYQQVYNQMMEAFADQWRPESEIEGTVNGRREAQNGQGRTGEDGQQAAGEREDNNKAGQSAENNRQIKTGGKKKGNMSSRKAR